MEDRWKWTDAHFCSLSSQTNVYGLTKVTGNEGTNKVLVAPLNGRVISIEYTQRDKRLTPCTKCIQFTYIPGKSKGESLQDRTIIRFYKLRRGVALFIIV